MKNQINALSKITEFIWNFLLIQICQVYMTVIWSALIYRIITCHQFHQQFFLMLKSIRVEIIAKLAKQQNMCLWLITDVYKTTLLIILKAEMYIFFLNLYLNSMISQTLKRMKKSDMTYQIEIICTVIRRKLCQRRQNHQISLTAVAYLKFLSVNWTQFWILLTENAQIKL